MLVHLDTARPLSEPKWAKSGDIQEWLKSMFGRMFWVAGDAAEGWEKKIQVVDPDPVRFNFILQRTCSLLASSSLLLYGLCWKAGQPIRLLESWLNANDS
jgi:hypothetical protein